MIVLYNIFSFMLRAVHFFSNLTSTNIIIILKYKHYHVFTLMIVMFCNMYCDNESIMV